MIFRKQFSFQRSAFSLFTIAGEKYANIKNRPEWPLDKIQQNKLFFNGFLACAPFLRGVAAKWLQNQVFSLVEVRHTVKHDGT
jgi:hypothetical protein